MGREHLTIVHSSPSVHLVAVRSQTVEANFVVAHSPVEGQRAEEWWETLSELLLAFVSDAPTYVCMDANGRLGLLLLSMLVVCLRIQKHPMVRGFIVSLWERTSVL